MYLTLPSPSGLVNEMNVTVEPSSAGSSLFSVPPVPNESFLNSLLGMVYSYIKP